MDNFNIFCKHITKRRERFNNSQEIKDLDKLIRLEEQALNHLDSKDPRHAGLAKQIATDHEIRSAISLALNGNAGTARVMYGWFATRQPDHTDNSTSLNMFI